MIHKSATLFLTIFSIIALSTPLKEHTIHSVNTDELSSKLRKISQSKSLEASSVTIIDMDSLFDVKNDTKAKLLLNTIDDQSQDKPTTLLINYFLMKGRKELTPIFDATDNEVICIESLQKFLRLITHKLLIILNKTTNISKITRLEVSDLINTFKNQKRSIIFVGKDEQFFTQTLNSVATDNESTVDVIIIKDDREQDSDTL